MILAEPHKGVTAVRWCFSSTSTMITIATGLHPRSCYRLGERKGLQEKVAAVCPRCCECHQEQWFSRCPISMWSGWWRYSSLAIGLLQPWSPVDSSTSLRHSSTPVPSDPVRLTSKEAWWCSVEFLPPVLFPSRCLPGKPCNQFSLHRRCGFPSFEGWW